MRIWETRFQVYDAIELLPVPHIVVEEVQDKPSYRMIGANRKGDFTCQLVYTLEGLGIFSDGRREHQLSSGWAFLAQHCDSATAYYYPQNGTLPWRFLWIAFSGGFASKLVKEFVSRYGYVYELPRDRGIISEMEAMKALSGTIQFLSPIDGLKLITEIFDSLENSARKKRPTNSSEIIKKTQIMILKNISSSGQVQDIAEKLSISREHLCRLFKRHAGISPEQYIRREKMRLACALLKESSLNCKQIAERTGYESPSSFSRAFRKFAGMTPEQFRRLGHLPKNI